ncbi:MAG: OB-fold domain-containing protein [Geminicoccaceae bacterium]|nr:OB-fold domain-containing protein [Geminicoccaceae bacterium]
MTDALAGLEVPGPTVTPLTEPFWAEAGAGGLSIQRCGSCGRAVFYPRAICPHCWGDALRWEAASGQGRLKSFSTVRKPGHPGWLPAAPYTVGLVELAEGPVMLSLILPGPRPVRVGDALVLAPTDIGGRVLPVFRLDATA